MYIYMKLNDCKNIENQSNLLILSIILCILPESWDNFPLFYDSNLLTLELLMFKASI
jgi:hypothetical protein